MSPLAQQPAHDIWFDNDEFEEVITSYAPMDVTGHRPSGWERESLEPPELPHYTMWEVLLDVDIEHDGTSCQPIFPILCAQDKSLKGARVCTSSLVYGLHLTSFIIGSSNW